MQNQFNEMPTQARTFKARKLNPSIFHGEALGIPFVKSKEPTRPISPKFHYKKREQEKRELAAATTLASIPEQTPCKPSSNSAPTTMVRDTQQHRHPIVTPASINRLVQGLSSVTVTKATPIVNAVNAVNAAPLAVQPTPTAQHRTTTPTVVATTPAMIPLAKEEIENKKPAATNCLLASDLRSMKRKEFAERVAQKKAEHGKVDDKKKKTTEQNTTRKQLPSHNKAQPTKQFKNIELPKSSNKPTTVTDTPLQTTRRSVRMV